MENTKIEGARQSIHPNNVQIKVNVTYDVIVTIKPIIGPSDVSLRAYLLYRTSTCREFDAEYENREFDLVFGFTNVQIDVEVSDDVINQRAKTRPFDHFNFPMRHCGRSYDMYRISKCRKCDGEIENGKCQIFNSSQQRL